MIKMILAVDQDNALGWQDGRLPWHIPADLKRFKELTSNSTVVMGFNTFKSLGRPNGLPNRKNIVLTTKPEIEGNAHIISNLDCIINEQYVYQIKERENIWIIGGASVYEQCLDQNIIEEIYITLVNTKSNADVKLVKYNLYNYEQFISSQNNIGIQWQVTENQVTLDPSGTTITYVTLKKYS